MAGMAEINELIWDLNAVETPRPQSVPERRRHRSPFPHHILESPGALALYLGSLFDPAPPGGDVLQSSHLRQRFQRGV